MKALCMLCNDILESSGQPDTCRCGRSFLDVGPDHYRGGGYLKYLPNSNSETEDNN